MLPTALQTLGRTTQAKPETIERAAAYIDAGGWSLTGKETPAEKAALLTAKNEAAKWLAAWREGLEPYWLVLYGETGAGKTYLARRLAKCVADNGEAVYRKQYADGRDYTKSFGYAQTGAVFAKWVDLVPFGASHRERYENAKTDWVKVIDDLMPKTGQLAVIDGEEGLEPKRFEADAALDLLDARLRRWTILTTNLTRQQFALFWDVRIASRFMRDGNACVDLTGVRDYNLRAK